MEDLPAAMRLAKRESQKSQHRFKLGAVIKRGKRVLSFAHNSAKTHPVYGSGDYNSLHAEGYAIYKAIRRGIDVVGADIFIYRTNGNLAKPCPCCAKMISQHGIRNVVYSGA
jgi:deoxycytidylate deaminase|tara:strand:+ start:547 stop:882 length:336 start_codon:yes stop_codon:yes gene_type:complete